MISMRNGRGFILIFCLRAYIIRAGYWIPWASRDDRRRVVNLDAIDTRRCNNSHATVFLARFSARASARFVRTLIMRFPHGRGNARQRKPDKLRYIHRALLVPVAAAIATNCDEPRSSCRGAVWGAMKGQGMAPPTKDLLGGWLGSLQAASTGCGSIAPNDESGKESRIDVPHELRSWLFPAPSYQTSCWLSGDCVSRVPAGALSIVDAKGHAAERAFQLWHGHQKSSRGSSKQQGAIYDFTKCRLCFGLNHCAISLRFERGNNSKISKQIPQNHRQRTLVRHQWYSAPRSHT